MMRVRAGLLAALLAGSAGATETVESPALAQVFARAGVKGSFVLYDVAADRMTVHQRKRANTRYYPASTFKIANTLIGLSTETVKTVDEVLPYGGKPQWNKEWERDMALRDAIKVSNVPVYQELARRIGMRRMKAELPRLDYGNGKIGKEIDTFWLNGPLKISAVEQTRFLAKLAEDKLAFSPSAMAATRDIIMQVKTPSGALFGKTGWTTGPNPDIGWWVGWVRKEGRTYAFALNIDIVKEGDGDRRVPVGRASLDALRVFPAN